MQDELLEIEIHKSPMWEINNPRVNRLLRATLDLVYHSKNMDNEQKGEVFNILISLVRIYGDPKLIKRDKMIIKLIKKIKKENYQKKLTGIGSNIELATGWLGGNLVKTSRNTRNQMAEHCPCVTNGLKILREVKKFFMLK